MSVQTVWRKNKDYYYYYYYYYVQVLHGGHKKNNGNLGQVWGSQWAKDK
jgi:hypothetical protein